jgi:alginate O-acetyltransferase complex protein AlgI
VWGARGLTFGLVSLGWPLFALDLPAFASMTANLFAGSGTTVLDIPLASWLLVGVAALVTFGLDTDRLTDPSMPEQRGHRLRQILLGLVTVAALTLAEGSRPFIYFQF